MLAGSQVASQSGFSTVVGTPHDLSLSGMSAESGGSDVCVFCHVSHGSSGDGPLWGRKDQPRSYIVYSSQTLSARPDQPDGNSKLCLSCHDGSLAVGSVKGGGEISEGLSPEGHILSNRPAYIGQDLSDDHPISFVYDSSLAVVNQQLFLPEQTQSQLGKTVTVDLLDTNRKVQCTSCHDAHNNSLGQFLRITTSQASLCITCHRQIDYELSVHYAAQSVEFNDNCVVCHVEHGGASFSPLLAKPERELCGTCHSQQALSMAPSATTRHPIDELDTLNEKKFTCGTCHEPHTIRPLRLYDRMILSDPQDKLRPRQLIDSQYVPHGYRNEPFLAVDDGDTFCMGCHNGSWPDALNIEPELISNAVQSQFTDGTRSLHRIHARRDSIEPSEPSATVGCTYCHDVHGTNGTMGIQRGNLLYDWITVKEFPYQGKNSCSTSDVMSRCHGPN